MERGLFFATSNRGKINEVSQLFLSSEQNIIVPSDLGISLMVEESGNSLEENAILKAKELLGKLGREGIVIADDSGIEIDALNGEPGVHTRRWLGREMEDDEILEYCLMRLKNVPYGKRTAHFKTVLAVTSKTNEIKTFQGELQGVILEEPIGSIKKGMPFAPVFYVPEWGMLLADTYDMPLAQKRSYVSHRVRAFQNAIPYILSLK